MAFQILLNFFVAFLWMFLKGQYAAQDFFNGYFFGLLMIFALRRFFARRFYLWNVGAVLKLIYIFNRELIMSNLAVLKVVLAPKINARPGIFKLETELKKDWEITILANLITLTPGTLVVEISEDNRFLYIHAMDLGDAEEARNDIKNTFEKAIQEVSR
ncbi:MULTISPECIES: Na+/H+ antiporter subunit E [Metabacillus]|jgi:multicomponent Na+:H+ antiporter subunit E|uniref:Monovalent cation/H+ antiporter subunit E n=1 Tax=Metabacillus indicus TaxID=246786 RepID=A0A084GKE1_METID|nr:MULTISPECIES: Na+/H+ antiporter subunit E [Metabacillus]KEZ47803.1 monovalent cation/H+ antiporter subunit E [Metabacillus indicus]KEZ48416.1 monovalent cation/H+ antiporter subunit E [Metabacillus indicus LMG 22858]MDX8290272.1 Na+/H+ antiporter subunit E [Metabacillus indicus]